MVRQNPAYRPIACTWNDLPRIFVGGRSVFVDETRGHVNRSASRLFCSLIAVLGSACASSRSAPPEIGTVRAADIPVSSTGPWAFSHSPGTREYRISRSASIQGWTDSVARQEVVSNVTHEILTLEPTGDELTFKAIVDKFDLTTEGAVGPAQSVQLPIELSGNLGSTGIRVDGSANGPCDAIRSIAVTDLHNLLAPFPARLARGMTWRDSINVSGCQAGIPTTTSTRRVFKVDGEVVHNGQSLLLLTRMDTLVSRGTGAYDQHRMEVGGTGSGSALYYLDPATGEVSHLITVQSSQIRVTTSGRVHAFTQIANQEFVRVR